jgi:hypothetical protein
MTPGHFAERLGLLATSGSAQALREAETLSAGTVQLVTARTDADISSFCQELSQRRRAVDPLDRPGNLGGPDSWENAGPWRHSGSTPTSCASAR